MLKRLLYIGLLFVAFVLTAGAQSNKKIKQLQTEQKSLKKNIAIQEGLLRSTKKDVSAQLANLQVISAQIEGQEKYVGEIHTELTGLAKDISGLETQLAKLEADLAVCKQRYRNALNYMFHGRMQLSKWHFIFSAKDFKDMYRRLRYMSQFSKYQKHQGEYIAQKEAEVKQKRAELLGLKTEKDKLYAEGKEQTRKLQSQQQERQSVVAELNKKEKELQNSIAQQRKKASALDARIDKLIQEEIAAAERRRKAAEERRRKEEAARQARLKRQREQAEAAKRAEERRRQTAAKDAKSATRTGKTTAKSDKSTAKSTSASRSKVSEEPRTAEPTFYDNDKALSNNFAANRGRLPMPITGSYAITTHFGQYNVEGLRGVQLDSKGINITGSPGAQARAVFKGEVTAIFAYGGMYNIIVRHGAYMSVYCNLSSTNVRNGQEVSARQTLGSVATDASGNCTLHFQLRKETSKLNPESWLAR